MRRKTMKKTISILLSFVFVITTFFCLPFYAWADGEGSLGTIENPLIYGDIPDGYNDTFKATKPEREVAEELRSAMVARNRIFEFEYSSDMTSVSKLSDYMVDFLLYAISDEASVSCVDGDYIHYQWENIEVSYVRDDGNNQYIIGLAFSYRSAAWEEYELDREIKAYLSALDMSSYSDYELLKEFHDHILEICDYNYSDMDYYRNYTCAGVFLDGEAVCQGYALAFYRLCREAGFDVRIIQSDPYEGCHGWNLVYIGDAYYYVDTTWDDELSNRHELFLVDYDTLQKLDGYNHEHKLYADLYDDDEYFNTVYRPNISETVYDLQASSISNCVIDVDYSDPFRSVVTDADGNRLTYGVDYTVMLSDDCYMIVEGMGDYAHTRSKRMLTVNSYTPSTEYTSVQYYGDDTSAPLVSVDGLVNERDYIVSYPSYDGAGTYYNVIQGVGKYTGVLYSKFTVEPIDIRDLGVSLSYTSTVYNGRAQQPDVIFAGAPGEVEYYIEEDPQTEAGVYPLTINGYGNYTGTVVLYYEIRKGTVNDFNISLSADSFVYDGRAKTPSVYVSGLLENRDFTVSFSDNISTGVAVVTVSGQGCYEGVRTFNFYILPKQTRAEVSSVTSSSATISWQGVEDVTGYKVEINSGGSWSQAADAGAAQTSVTVSGLNPYTTYRFRVIPYKYSRGETVFAYSSNEIAALTNYVPSDQTAEQTVKAPSAKKVKKVTKPKKTKITKLTSAKKSFTVKWKKVSCTGYQIQYSTSSKFKKAKTVTVKGSKKTSKKISKLKKGKKYYVRVRAYKTVNGKKVYGSWSAKKSVRVK